MNRPARIATAATLVAVSAGLAVLSAVLAIFLHPLVWSMPLIAMTALAVVLALPAGVARVVFALVWAGTLVIFGLGRPEGDWVLGNDLTAYVLFSLAVVWMVMALITLPQRRARHSDPGPDAA